MKKLSALMEGLRLESLQGLDAPAGRPLYLSGLVGSSPSALAASQFLKGQGNLLYLARDIKSAENLADDLESWIPKENLVYFPGLDLKPYEWRSPFGHVMEQRLRGFEHLYNGKRAALVTTWDTFLHRLSSPESLHLEILSFTAGERLSISDFRQAVVHMGFTENAVVQDIGEFSVRGEIIDVYPFLLENPVRIVLFGDEIESIREFDIFTQRSVKDIPQVNLFPMDECCYSPKELEEGLFRNLEQFGAEDVFESESQKLLVRRDLTGIYWQKSFFKSLSYTLLDFLGKDTRIIIEDWDSIEERSDKFWDGVETGHSNALAKEFVVSQPKSLFLTIENAKEQLNRFSVYHLGRLSWEGKSCRNYQIDEQIRGGGGLSQTEDYIQELHDQGQTIFLMSPNEGQAERLKKLVQHLPVEDVLVGHLHCGFICRDDAIALLTDHQIFNRFSRKVRQKKYKGGGGISMQSIEALTRGDFVVHEDYGVGKYIGITRIRTDKHSVDCILVEYSQGGKLTLPVSDLRKLEKYSSKEGQAPTLNRLGGKTWDLTKEKTKRSIIKLAQELIDLYAKRSMLPGFPFSPDNALQQEFEQAFEFEPTPDQVQASDAVKRDMERPRPTDRLICGDVGFGKTEVAMRAAFKALQDKKQVAVLAPTTILAAQHFNTFSERFAAWPITIDYLNRFKNAKEQKLTLQALEKGQIDVIIGTHRLLSQDVRFKELGLLIIDEEQKFGVKHKERFKEMRTELEVISMSATPIPRTLHMAMVGARDLSLIATPPRNRLPIDTKVVPNDPKILQEAMEHELERGGQIFFVHNRIEDLPLITERVEAMVPKARVGMAHGQMNEVDLEQVMSAFVNREYDVLVCTAIIESGLDITNVNTIIINRAELFGLSQLYQLRGRVGRSSTQAFCLLVSPDSNKFTDEAKKRLYSLQKFTELGSGYQIAMRDLEIRGAGNILGMEQSGHIQTVGFETYCRLLKEAMEELRGGKPILAINPEIELPDSAYLPEEYIADGLQRISLYQKISRLDEVQQIDEMLSELEDRFGKAPVPAKNLLATMVIRLVAQKLGFQKIELERQFLHTTFSEMVEISPQELGPLLAKCKRPVKIVYGKPLELVIELVNSKAAEAIDESCRVLRELL